MLVTPQECGCASSHTTAISVPGTTPLVAMALMEMAVSIVCGAETRRRRRERASPLCEVKKMSSTHAAAADEDDAERLQHTGRSHHPGQPQEQDDPKNVLQAGQIDTHEGSHLRRLEEDSSSTVKSCSRLCLLFLN